MKNRSLTIRLDEGLEQELEAACSETGRSRGEIVRDALRRQLQLMRFERLRRQALPFGFLRDQPVASRSARTLQVGLVDADDERVLASAVLAEADLFVTGDQGVLACSRPPVPIVTPRSCWEQLRGGG